MDSLILPSLALGFTAAAGLGSILMLPYWLGLK